MILAGGLGTRMKPLTEKIPKSLVPIQGRPFLHYQLEYLRRQNVSRVVLCIGHMGDRIRQYAGDGSRWGLPLEYVEEGESLKGTAGALRLALDAGKLEKRFLVLYGDSFLPIDFKAVWTQFQKTSFPALLVVMKNEGKWDKSNVDFNGGKVILYDKKLSEGDAHRMQYIDYGLSAFSQTVIEQEVPQGRKSDLADVYHRLSLRGELGGHEVTTRFFEIGSPTGLKDFSAYIKSQKDEGESP